MSIKKYELRETKTLGYKPIPLFQIWRDGHYYEAYQKVSEMRPLQTFINDLLSSYNRCRYEVELYGVLLSVDLYYDEEPVTGKGGHSIENAAIWTGDYWVPFDIPDDWDEDIITDAEQQMIDDSFCEPC